MMTLQGQRWRMRAVCYVETADAPQLWTPECRPTRDVRVHLERMCRRCPVRRACAADAVASEAEGGMYAGVWVPERRKKAQWSAAMDRLGEIGGVDALTGLGVSA